MFHETVFPFTSIPQVIKYFDLFYDRVLPCRIPIITPLSNSIYLSVDFTTTIIAPFSQNLRSSRPSQVIKPSSYLKDFHCNYVSHNNVPKDHPLSHVLSYDRLSSNHKAFFFFFMSFLLILNQPLIHKLLRFLNGMRL